MTGAHRIMVTAYDGEGVGLDCSCGWSMLTGSVAVTALTLNSFADEHLEATS